MIDEVATFKQFGYKSTDWAQHSDKKVIAVCDGCGKARTIFKSGYRDLCHSCAASNISKETRKRMSEAQSNRSKEHRKRQSEAQKGEKNHRYGKIPSEKTRKKISEGNKGKTPSEETRKKLSDAQKRRKPPSEKTRKKMSEAQSNRSKEHRKKISEAHKGKPRSEETRKKMSEANKGKTHSEEAKKKISEAQKGEKNTNYGKIFSEETRKKLSAAHQGIPYEQWENYAREKKYCPKFNNACKESNREKYGRRCFICNKTEKANGQKLSVHHVDLNKAQGCESNWKLVPLCRACHNKAHNEELIARLGYLIKQ